MLNGALFRIEPVPDPEIRLEVGKILGVHRVEFCWRPAGLQEQPRAARDSKRLLEREPVVRLEVIQIPL